jgi:hypothetical protein
MVFIQKPILLYFQSVPSCPFATCELTPEMRELQGFFPDFKTGFDFTTKSFPSQPLEHIISHR